MDETEFMSLWQTEKRPEFPRFRGDETAQAVVVGGGICGLLCAYELLQNGVKDIVLLEARKICGGATGHTTGKITSQHGLIYRKLTDGLGRERAEEYARRNEEAIGRFRKIVETEKIDCDFIPCSAYLYALTDDGVRRLEAEADAAQHLSVDARIVHDCEIPLPVRAALCFPNQARFHPLKFAYRLAEILRERGVRIFEDSLAIALEDNTVVTREGRVYGKNVVLCTHYPFTNFKGMYYTRIVQSRSYVLALENARKLDGMYLDCEQGGCSFRSQPREGGDILLFSMFDHKTGHETGAPHYRRMEEEAKKLYPESAVRFRWSAQDCMTNDGIPYIGRYRQQGNSVYLASGFNKWGMTGSMAAADLISGLIVSGGDDCTVFSPSRSDFSMQAPVMFREIGDVVANFTKGYLEPPGRSLSELKNGEGGLAEYQGAKIGAYRDEEGALHGVNPVCPHMHCPLRWNPEERTWDCPCHGSRFDETGKVMENPASRPLEQRGPD
ncbi:MAG: FAD-dependent oxidoreductase [Oscillospiraceae bacterium]|nr:FAD-dependent oxidoreductase [Oscillospiraceae bacterium]MCI1991339.1 FAD-dependent oxidoreductase [Oscillospiraceae bacterium]MCI2036300.1 FAD-dependent oxidoreductase [Oscillospiraceae bacterium]